MKQGDLVKISPRILSWRNGDEWGTIAIASKIEGMMITLVCNTGNVRELPVQLASQYLEVVNETR